MEKDFHHYIDFASAKLKGFGWRIDGSVKTKPKK